MEASQDVDVVVRDGGGWLNSQWVEQVQNFFALGGEIPPVYIKCEENSASSKEVTKN